MPYATPTLYCSAFGLDEAVGMLADDSADQQLLTADLLRQAVAVQEASGTWSVTATDDDKAAALAAYAQLLRQIANVSNYMDGYLRAAVTLPLAGGDANLGTLEDCCLALVRYELADDADGCTDQIIKRADTWRQWLKDVSRKVVALVAADGTTVQPGGGSVRTGQARSGFDWGAHSRNSGGMLP